MTSSPKRSAFAYYPGYIFKRYRRQNLIWCFAISVFVVRFSNAALGLPAMQQTLWCPVATVSCISRKKSLCPFHDVSSLFAAIPTVRAVCDSKIQDEPRTLPTGAHVNLVSVDASRPVFVGLNFWWGWLSGSRYWPGPKHQCDGATSTERNLLPIPVELVDIESM